MNHVHKILGIAGVLAAVAFAGPVSWYGALTVDGNKIKNSTKTMDVQLKGPSLFWSDFSGRVYYNEPTVNFFVENMDISVIRAAMAIRYYNNESTAKIYDGAGNYGYLSTEEPTAKTGQKAIINEVVQAAIVNDIYVIIDWHSHTAHTEQADAVAFFTEMANLYKNVPNVIFEIYNEPTNSVGNSSVFNYAKAVIGAIRGTGNNNLILVGSTSWSSNPASMASEGGGLHKSYANIAYTLHFYANTHGGSSSQRSSGASALAAGAAVFVSEWGTTSADGGGTPNQSESQNWMTWMDQNKVGSCNWSAAALSETSAMWSTAASALTVAGLSASGQIFNNYMKTTINKPPTGYPWGKSLTVSVMEGETKTLSLTDLGATSGATVSAASTPPAGMGTFTAGGSSLTYVAPATATQAIISLNYTLTLAGKNSKHRITFKFNRKPVIAKNYLAVSKTKPTTVSFITLGVTDADNDVLKYTTVTTTAGTAVIAADGKTFVLTPPANFVPQGQDSAAITLNITVTDAKGLKVSAVVTAMVRNLAPTSKNLAKSIANTSESYITILDVAANDPDGDDAFFGTVRVEAGYPGTIGLSVDMKTFAYVPAPGKISGEKVPVIFTVTDGKAVSAEYKVSYTITGTGSAIVRDPSAVNIKSGSKPSAVFSMTGRTIHVSLQGLGNAVLDLVDLHGKRVAVLWEGNQSVQFISAEIPNLKHGLYIARLRSGSTLISKPIMIR